VTDYYLGVMPQRMSYELRSNVARFSSPLSGTVRTLERTGARLAVTWHWDSVKATEIGRLRAFIHQQRGGANRFWAPVAEQSIRGSYSASELLSNNTFSSGTTGWSPSAATALTASDSVLRLTRTTGGAGSVVYAGQVVTTLVQYAPFAMRVLTHFATPGETNYGASFVAGSVTVTSYSSSPTLKTAHAVVLQTTGTGYIDHSGAAGTIAGAYREVPYTSFARCALVDNGVNMLVRSDEFDNASWLKTECTVGANATTAPDAATTADSLIESVNNIEHQVRQTGVTISSSVGDYSYTVAVKAGARTWCRIQMNLSGSTANAYVNLSTGAVGLQSVAGSFSNLRVFVVSLGNGWYQISIVAYKSSADTSIGCYVVGAEADNDVVYVGDGATAGLYMWRATLAQSSVPTRLVQTTSAATTGTSQTGGAVYLKGLPVSTSGLLLAGDWVEFVTPTYGELKRVIAPLNSDAGGRGYLQFETILRESPADNAAVIVRNPLGRFLLDESSVQWGVSGDGFQSVQFTGVEDIAA